MEAAVVGRIPYFVDVASVDSLANLLTVCKSEFSSHEWLGREKRSPCQVAVLLASTFLDTTVVRVIVTGLTKPVATCLVIQHVK